MGSDGWAWELGGLGWGCGGGMRVGCGVAQVGRVRVGVGVGVGWDGGWEMVWEILL